MASSTSDLIVRLSLDTTNFEGAMSKFEGQMTKLQASCTNASTGITNFKQVTAQLQTSAQTLTDKLAAQKQKVADLEAAYEKSKAETGENSEETKKLAAQLEQAKQKVSQTEQALKLVTRQLKLSQNGFYQLGTQLENIGAKLEAVGKKVSQVGQQLTTKVTTPIVALGTVCVKTFTSFDDSLKTVQATMGLVAGSSEEADRQIALLNSTAQEMGRATRYSASEAASALNYLALAGYDADEACAALPQVLALAQAGGLDLAYASDLATDAMAALGLSMDQLSNFSDQMAVTAQKSNTSVGQLGEAILTVGGTAKNLKGGTAELNAELGILANRGIKGAEGGTHLRNVILSLTNPTDKAAAQMEKLGVSVFDSSGNMRSMNDIMMDLNRSMDGMTAEQKQNIISTIFNKTDLAAVTALLDGCGDEFNELIGYIDDSEGAARQIGAHDWDDGQHHGCHLHGLPKQIQALSAALIGRFVFIEHRTQEQLQRPALLVVDVHDGGEEVVPVIDSIEQRHGGDGRDGYRQHDAEQHADLRAAIQGRRFFEFLRHAAEEVAQDDHVVGVDRRGNDHRPCAVDQLHIFDDHVRGDDAAREHHGEHAQEGQEPMSAQMIFGQNIAGHDGDDHVDQRADNGDEERIGVGSPQHGVREHICVSLEGPFRRPEMNAGGEVALQRGEGYDHRVPKWIDGRKGEQTQK